MRATTPQRIDVADSQISLLRFLRDAAAQGPAALAILTEIRGGAARSLGAMVAVAQDGGYCGYVSGGCVEAAVAAEALVALQEERDRQVLYGEGSAFFDIALPCGGGLTISIHALKDTHALDEAISALEKRSHALLLYERDQGLLTTVAEAGQTGWTTEGRFALVLKPELRIAISGDGLEARALTRIADACGYQTRAVEDVGDFDPWTAVIFLRHDVEAELSAMVAAVHSNAGYIGALGSRKTHQKRVERLTEAGVLQAAIARIHAPIGLFGPTRHSSALALSILAQIASLDAAK